MKILIITNPLERQLMKMSKSSQSTSLYAEQAELLHNPLASLTNSIMQTSPYYQQKIQLHMQKQQHQKKQINGKTLLMMNIQLEQLDVKTAFLNAKVSEDIYMEAPDGLKLPSDKVLKLNKALYGIKQAPKEWNDDISNYLKNELGFKQCIKDTCLYVKR